MQGTPCGYHVFHNRRPRRSQLIHDAHACVVNVMENEGSRGHGGRTRVMDILVKMGWRSVAMWVLVGEVILIECEVKG